MTKENFVQYTEVCAELRELRRAAEEPVADTVRASRDTYPYTQRTVTIRGVPPLSAKDAARIEALERQKASVEQFVEAIASPRKRRLMRYVMQYGCRWNVIRRRMDDDKSADAIRMEFERMFK